MDTHLEQDISELFPTQQDSSSTNQPSSSLQSQPELLDPQAALVEGIEHLPMECT